MLPPPVERFAAKLPARGSYAGRMWESARAAQLSFHLWRRLEFAVELLLSFFLGAPDFRCCRLRCCRCLLLSSLFSPVVSMPKHGIASRADLDVAVASGNAWDMAIATGAA